MSRLYIAAGGALLILGIAAALLIFGRESGRTAADRDALQAEIETRERIDNADTGFGDPVRDTEWLRQRGSR